MNAGPVTTETEDALALFEPDKFATPPGEYAPGIQWLWPGGSVDDAALEAQVKLFASVGYRTVALQTWRSGISSAQVAADPQIATVGEPSYFAHVRTVARVAREHGVQYELTLGSGWPNGGVALPRDAMEQQMFWQRTNITGPGTIDVTLPPPVEPSSVKGSNLEFGGVMVIGPFDMLAQLEAVVAGPLLEKNGVSALGDVIDVTGQVVDGKLKWAAPAGSHVVLSLFRNTTSHILIGATFPGDPTDARVLDHLGPNGSRWLIDHQINPWLDALGEDRPMDLFIDSFELIGELPWSPSLAARYEARVGHAPYTDMPFLFRQGSESKYVEITRESSPPALAAADPEHAERIREDYESVRAEAFHEEFLKPVVTAMHARGVKLRMQAHGGWGAVLGRSSS
jgi:hypothetical protein